MAFSQNTCSSWGNMSSCFLVIVSSGGECGGLSGGDGSNGHSMVLLHSIWGGDGHGDCGIGVFGDYVVVIDSYWQCCWCLVGTGGDLIKNKTCLKIPKELTF